MIFYLISKSRHCRFYSTQFGSASTKLGRFYERCTITRYFERKKSFSQLFNTKWRIFFVQYPELINNHLSMRLPPVPEEGTDEAMFGRNDVYDFPSIIMGNLSVFKMLKSWKDCKVRLNLIPSCFLFRF